MKKLLAIDYSTQSTGYAVFDIETKKLLLHSVIKIGTAKVYNTYPFGTLRKLEAMAEAVLAVVNNISPDLIVIEEVNQGISRMGQKTLNGGHFILLKRLTHYDGKLFFKSSDGKDGWRKELNLVLSDSDKEYNKKVREVNKKVPKELRKDPLTKKHVTARWVNQAFQKSFDVDKVSSDSDQADAIGLGYAAVIKMK